MLRFSFYLNFDVCTQPQPSLSIYPSIYLRVYVYVANIDLYKQISMITLSLYFSIYL